MFPTSETLTRAVAWLEDAARWGPAVPVALMFAVALFQAAVLPGRLWVKGIWVLAVALCGLGVVGLLRWQQDM